MYLTAAAERLAVATLQVHLAAIVTAQGQRMKDFRPIYRILDCVTQVEAN